MEIKQHRKTNIALPEPTNILRNHSVLIISTSSFSMASRLARCIMIFLPNEKTDNAVIAQQAITPVIGKAVWFCKTLTSADVHAPMLI